ncbi:MAG: hypothetical protein AAF670_04910 [Planctomycetota bacterium]
MPIPISTPAYDGRTIRIRVGRTRRRSPQLSEMRPQSMRSRYKSAAGWKCFVRVAATELAFDPSEGCHTDSNAADGGAAMNHE